MTYQFDLKQYVSNKSKFPVINEVNVQKQIIKFTKFRTEIKCIYKKR